MLCWYGIPGIWQVTVTWMRSCQVSKLIKWNCFSYFSKLSIFDGGGLPQASAWSAIWKDQSWFQIELMFLLDLSPPAQCAQEYPDSSFFLIGSYQIQMMLLSTTKDACFLVITSCKACDRTFWTAPPPHQQISQGTETCPIPDNKLLPNQFYYQTYIMGGSPVHRNNTE